MEVYVQEVSSVLFLPKLPENYEALDICFGKRFETSDQHCGRVQTFEDKLWFYLFCRGGAMP